MQDLAALDPEMMSSEGMTLGDYMPEPEPSPVEQQIQAYAEMLEAGDVSGWFEDDIEALGAKVVQEYKLDRNSRSDWEKTAERAMKMARQEKEGKSWPWPNASNVKYPMLTTAALQFAARAYPGIMNGPRVVKCKVAGKDEGGEKAARGERVSQHMSFQLTQEMPEWEEDLDTMLHQLPITGCAFRKVYFDPLSESGCSSTLISAMDFVVNQKAKHLETVPRMTHCVTLYPYEIEERQRSGFYREVDIDLKGEDGSEDDEAPQTFLEQHRYWDSDGDGLSEPWIITVHENSETIVRMVPNFDLDKIKAGPDKIISIPRKKYFVKIPFIPDPNGGFYDIGFGKLLESLSDIVDTTINQMMDAGTLQNAGGGLIGSGLKLGKSKIKRRPGEYTTVEATGSDIRQAVYDFQSPGPAPVLLELLGLMIESGKDIAAIKDVLTGDSGERAMTATTTMALIEQGLKVFSAIFKRIYRALTQEFKLVYACNAQYLDQEKYFTFLDEEVQTGRQDYADDLNVLPQADPNVITDMQRMIRAQFLLEQVEKGNPHINPLEATRRSLEAANIENLEKVLIEEPQQGPSEDEKEAMGIELDNKAADTKKKLAEAEKIEVEAAVTAMQPITETVDGKPDAEQQAPQQMPPMQPEMMPEPELPMGMPPEQMGMAELPPEMMDPEMLAQLEAEEQMMQQQGPIA